MTLLILIAFFGGAAPAPGSVLSPDDHRALDGPGTCVGSDGPVDLDRVLFLENRSILIDGRKGPLRVSIDGEDLLIKEMGESSRQREYFNNIGYQVDEADDLDVELKLAWVKGRLAVYWRETYRNRVYRQGLFAINESRLFEAGGKELTPICAGRGGSRSAS